MLLNPSIDFVCGKTLVKFLETKVLNNDNNSFGGLFFFFYCCRKPIPKWVKNFFSLFFHTMYIPLVYNNFENWYRNKLSIKNSKICLPIHRVEFAIRYSKVEICGGSSIVMKINHTFVIDVSLGESHHRVGKVIGQYQLTKGRRLHDVIR